jgi:hypothetical protein
MSTSNATLSLTLKAKNLAGKEVDGLRGSMGKLGGAAGKAGGALKTFGIVGVAGIAVVAAAALAALPKLMDMAGKLELMQGKAETVFGDQLGVVEKWAKTNANAMGLTSREAVGLSANFADLLIPMGFTRKAAATMSTEVVGLSGALSQWSSGTYDAAQVSEILAKAMLGERDGLKALGISISESDVKARLLANGNDKLTGAALAQATALATQQLIMEKSADAQAAYAGSSETLAGKQHLLGAKFSELTESIVLGITPALEDIMSFIMDVAVPAVEDFVDEIVDWLEANDPLIQQIKNSLLGTVEKFIAFITDEAVPMVEGFIRKIGHWIDANDPLIEQIKKLIDEIKDRLMGTIKRFIDIVKEVIKFIEGVVDSIANNEDAMSNLGTIFGDIAALADELLQLIEKVIGGIQGLADKISKGEGGLALLGIIFKGINDQIKHTIKFLRDVVDGAKLAIDLIAGLFADRGPSPLMGMPGFAHGGWAGLNGPEAIIVGEQGPEFIVPNGGTAPGGMGGAPAVVVLQLDGREVARVVDERLFYRRQLSPT